MSDLPRGWVETRLDEIAAINPPLIRNLGDDDVVSFVPMASVEAETGRLDPSQRRPASEVRGKSYRSFAEGDVLFAKVTPCMENGKIALAVGLTNGLGFGSSEFHVVRPFNGISAKFILHFLLQKRFRNNARRDMSGTAGLLRVSSRFLESSMIPVPPSAEQERIVAAIEEQFSRLDAGTAALDRVRHNLKRMRNTVHQTAISGRLVDPEPSSWRTVSVGDVAEVSGGITKNPKRAPHANPVAFLRVANVPRDGLDLENIHVIEIFDGELERYRLRPGDLLVVEGNGSPDQIGRSALWNGEIDPCVHQNHLIRVRPSAEVVPEYLNLYWNAPSTMAIVQALASSTSGLHTLSTGKIRGIPVKLPSVDAQRVIVEEVAVQLSRMSTLETAVTDAMTRAANLRSAILNAAFSGKLMQQDPSDEPASRLLEQIASESASHLSHKPTSMDKRRITRAKVPA